MKSNLSNDKSNDTLKEISALNDKFDKLCELLVKRLLKYIKIYRFNFMI